MVAARTRVVATSLALLGFFLAALYAFANHPSGTFGLDAAFLSGKPAMHVFAVDAGGAAQAAGLRAGDLVFAAHDSLAGRAPLFLFANAPLVAAGDSVRVLVERDGKRRIVPLTARRNPSGFPYEALFFCALATPMLLLGWLLLWRKPESADAVTLGIMLLLFGLFIAAPDRSGTPLARFFVSEIFATACIIAAVAVAAIFFARYPEGAGVRRSPWRRSLLIFSIAVSIVNLGIMAFQYIGPAYVGAAPWLLLPTIITVAAPILAAFLCFVNAFRHGDETERTRLRWLGGAYFIGFTGPILLPPLTLLLGPRFTVIHQVLLESTLFILALGLTYAVLQRRVVDISFVLNRALVFSAVSAIVVALFIGIEWLTGLLFLNVSRSTSFLVEAAIAVAIGFSLRPIHKKVDHVIDRVFFAKRHAAERALHHLATEVNFIRDRGALTARVQRDVSTYLEVPLVSIYHRDDVQGNFLLIGTTQDAPEFIDADDDAVVSLTVQEQPVQLHGRATSISGELAIPLAVRKMLVGVLVLGERPSHEAFAPDEIESLRFLANNLAPSLAANAGRRDSPEASILSEILAELRSQREELRALSSRLATEEK